MLPWQGVKDAAAAARAAAVVKAEVAHELNQFYAALRPRQSATLRTAPTVAAGAASIRPAPSNAGGIITDTNGTKYNIGTACIHHASY
jgi:hypothetical protein